MRTLTVNSPVNRRQTLVTITGLALALAGLALVNRVAAQVQTAQTSFAPQTVVGAPGSAPAFPTRPVRLVVPFPPGGATDIIGRLLAQKMSEVWGQQVIVDNKPGAGTVVGTNFVAKSAPDGYTMGVVITAHVINPSLRGEMPYDTIKDLSGVTHLAQAHLALLAPASFAANNVAELIALARKEPGKLSYATPGSGTAMHLGVEMLKSQTGIDIVHIPYKGGALGR